MTSMSVVYEGDMKCKLTYDATGSTISTMGPKEFGGDMSTFSPTDLVVAALGACILTTIGTWAIKKQIAVEGAKVNASKEMSTDSPRRIARIPVTITIPATVPEENRASLERAAGMCAVKKSLNPEMDIPIEFVYE